MRQAALVGAAPPQTIIHAGDLAITDAQGGGGRVAMTFAAWRRRAVRRAHWRRPGVPCGLSALIEAHRPVRPPHHEARSASPRMAKRRCRGAVSLPATPLDPAQHETRPGVRGRATGRGALRLAADLRATALAPRLNLAGRAPPIATCANPLP